jgi:MFS family permease
LGILRAYRGLLADRDLLRLLFGEFVSSIGDWLYLVALLVVVYQRSNDTLLLGIVGAARILPYVFLSVPAGIVADRFDRRLILLSTDIARGAIMVALAALVAVDGPLWAIVALSILATCFSSFFGPTIGSYLPMLVGDESRLGPANSAWASLDNLSFVVGPAIAGLLIAGSGLTLAFILNALSFAVVAVVLWRLPSGRPANAGVDATGTHAGGASKPAAEAAIWRSIAVRVAGLGLLSVVAEFCFGGLTVLTVVLATSAFHAGEEATGYLNAAIGVGGLVGAVGSGALVLRPRLGPPLIIGGLLLGAGVITLGAVSSLPPALIAIAVASAGILLTQVVGATIFQRVVPDAIRGRALGAIATAAMLAYAAGSFALPVLTGLIGVLPVLVVSGLAIVVCTFVAVAAVGPAATRSPGADEPLLRHIATLPVFAGVPPARLEAILARRHMRDVEAGEVVIRQGEPPDRFAVITDGRFAVTRREDLGSEETHMRTMGPDEVFGEIGLLSGVPRTATVTAETDGRLLELDGPDFIELVSAGPGLASRFLDIHRGTRALVGRRAG